MYRSLSLLFTLLLVAAPVLAQPGATGGLTPYHVTQIKTVGEAVTSPDGDWIAYTVRVPADPLEDNASVRSELHLYDVTTGERSLALDASVNPRAIRWVPESDELSFLAYDSDLRRTVLYTFEAPTGVRRMAASFETSIGSYVWHEDGERIAFIATEPAEAPSGVQVPYRPEVYEEEVLNQGVYHTRAFSDAAPTRLPIEGTAYTLAWHPGDFLAVAAAPSPYVDDRYMRQAITILSASTGEIRGEVMHEGKLGAMDWSADGDHLAFIGSANINDPKEGRLYVVDDDGSDRRDVLPGLEGHVKAIEWLDDEVVSYIAALGTETEYGAVEEDGENQRPIIPAGYAAFESVSANAGGDIVALVGHTWEHPREAYLWTQDDRAPTRITDSNPWLSSVQLAEQEVIEYEARDGLRIEGMLIHPLGRKASNDALIMVVHGGPESHYANGWLTGYSLPGQMAAARGYAVFYPNYRGSTGRGVAFSTTSQADPAGAEFDDLIDGVDHLIAQGMVDAERVGVTGGSYGGYATGWLSTRYSDRIAAGVMFVGISNKVSKVGTTDIPNEEFYVHARKRPWDDWQFFLERSPIYYAGQSRTPLLIMHGKDDPRVDPGQSFELYRHLRLRGQAPVRLVLYPGEGHGNRRATAQYDYSLRALRWFDHFLMGEGGEAPPHALDYAFPEEARMGTN